MAYFNHAFSKRFLGTGPTITITPTPSPTNPSTQEGYLITPGVTSAYLSTMGPGYFGLFNANTYVSVNPSVTPVTGCCPLILASSSLYAKDKVSPYIGGYQETNKSKYINPKYVRDFYRVDACTPEQAIVSIGNTPQTAGMTDPNNFQGGTTAATCCFEFLCGETYYLRVDIKGSPTLRFLNHQSYHTVDAYTGCCVGPTPTVVDSTLVMISWANELINSDYTKAFILPVVFDETGTPWYAPGTTIDPITGAPIAPYTTWDNYVSPGHTAGACAGLRLFGAYVETKFGNCSFQVTDFFEKEPVRIYASMVDYNGDPCVFSGICVYTDCRGVQGMGFGEQVLRDLILSESYLQNFFHTDIRIREITQGSDILSAVNRNALYTRYYILHSVPRFNNPSGTFDNDQYMLEVITNGTIARFESDMATWLGDCGNGCSTLKTYDCVHCEPVDNDGLVR
jgi:hypothetical protein